MSNVPFRSPPPPSEPTKVEIDSTERPPTRRWTFGNSDDLVDGHPRESRWVSISWIVVPLLLGLGLIAAFF